MKFPTQILMSGLAAVLAAGSAQAAITINGVNYISPVAVTTAGLNSFGDFPYNFQPGALCDGSGIDAETGFATANQTSADGFSAYPGASQSYIMFDLGSQVSLASFHIWSRSIGSVSYSTYDTGAGGIRNFTVSTSASNQVTQTNGTEGYVFNDPVNSFRVTDLPSAALLGSNPSNYAGQSFNLTGTARYVMFSNNLNLSEYSWYTSRNVREALSINEVQFAAAATSAVPEASTSLGLLALGAGGLLTRRRLKRKA